MAGGKAKKPEKTGTLENALGIVAALLVLATTMLDARIGFALAINGLFAFAFIMKEKAVKQVLFSVAALGIAAIPILVSNPKGNEAWIAAIIIGLAIWVIIIYNARKRKEEIASDERVIKISNRAMAYSWWLAYMTIALMLWFDYTGLVELSVVSFGTIVFIVMLVSQALIKKYLLTRGEDE